MPEVNRKCFQGVTFSGRKWVQWGLRFFFFTLLVLRSFRMKVFSLRRYKKKNRPLEAYLWRWHVSTSPAFSPGVRQVPGGSAVSRHRLRGLLSHEKGQKGLGFDLLGGFSCVCFRSEEATPPAHHPREHESQGTGPGLIFAFPFQDELSL